MATIPGTDMTIELQNNERVAVFKSADGYFASQHPKQASKPCVVITDQRFIACAQQGLLKKRLEEVASWSLSSFTGRLNTSQGAALGSFMHVLTLFTNDGETASIGFKSERDRDSFKQAVVQALARYFS